MDETFYSALGVSEDADAGTIRDAYRDRVKEHHPDVSDDAAAAERFRRLTTARDVLVDEGERARYDRLGHETYVSRHVQTSAWTVDRADDSTSEESVRGQKSGGVRGGDRAAWVGPKGEETAGGSGDGNASGGGRRRRASGTTATGDSGERWQRASRTYRRADTDVGSERSGAGRVVDGLRALGPWLVVDVVFVLSAVATGWFTYTQASRYVELSLPALVAGVATVALVVVVTILHAVSQVYS